MDENREGRKNQSEDSGVGRNTLLVFLLLALAIIVLSAVASRLIGRVGRRLSEQIGWQTREPSSDQQRETSGPVKEKEEKVSNLEVPENFPKDIPLYEGASLSAAASSDTVVSVTMETSDPLAAVRDFYAHTLLENGWTILETAELGSALVLSFEKEGVTGVLAVTESEGETSITLSIEQQEGESPNEPG